VEELDALLAEYSLARSLAYQFGDESEKAKAEEIKRRIHQWVRNRERAAVHQALDQALNSGDGSYRP
jgi:hypothetical protein